MKQEQIPQLYLSKSEGHWRTILQGQPCCKDFDTLDNPLIIYHKIREQYHWDNTNNIPVWNGDTGKFQIMDNFTHQIRDN